MNVKYGNISFPKNGKKIDREERKWSRIRLKYDLCHFQIHFIEYLDEPIKKLLKILLKLDFKTCFWIIQLPNLKFSLKKENG